MSASCDVDYDFVPALGVQLGSSVEPEAHPQAEQLTVASDRGVRVLRFAMGLALAVLSFFAMPELLEVLEYNSDRVLLGISWKRHG